MPKAVGPSLIGAGNEVRQSCLKGHAVAPADGKPEYAVKGRLAFRK